MSTSPFMNGDYRLCFFLIVVFALAFSAAGQSLPPNQGCCTNPNAAGYVCLPVQGNPTNPTVTQNSCCPPVLGSFYNTVPNGLGPQNFAQCIANNYFPGQYCNQITPPAGQQIPCVVGCCCDPIGTTTFPVFQVQCHPPSSNFNPNIASQAQCNALCNVVQTECNDNINNDPNNNNCADELDTGCGQPYDPQDPTEAGGTCIVYGPCNNPVQPPQITSLTLTPVRGEQKMALSWLTDCFSSVQQFQIYRCQNAGCTNFALLGTVMGATTFTDQSATLLWDTMYRYKVVATYTISGITTTSERIEEGSIGNLECFGQMNSNPFCVSQAYYSQFSSYLSTNNIPVSSFSSRFNTAFMCDAQNILSTVQSCPGTQVCVVTTNQGVASAGCSIQGNCNSAVSGPFGLLVTRNLCEMSFTGQQNYCTLDYSPTIVDRCYACNQNMRCYDYHSSGACNSDNCGIGSCQWREYDPEFHRGVCVSATQNNCQYCDMASSSPTIPTKDAYNPILDVCTSARAGNLSTAQYPCVVIGSAAQSCTQISCLDYAQAQCGAGAITHNAYNQLLGASQDPCNFRACQWFAGLGGCRKNADGTIGQASGGPDCPLGDAVCEHDLVPPNTTLTVLSTNNLQDTILLHIEDKLTLGGPVIDVTLNANVRTYFCVIGPGSSCSSGHPYAQSSSTTSDVLNIYQLGLFDTVLGPNGFPKLIANLTSGQNTVRYYTQDVNKNIEVVKEVVITAYDNPMPPQVAGIIVQGSPGPVANTYSTANTQPQITITFYSPGNTLQNVNLTKSSGQVFIPSVTNINGQQFTLSFANSLSLGQYTLAFGAQSGQGLTMPPVNINIVINNIAPLINITSPSQNQILSSSLVQFLVNASEGVSLRNLTISGPLNFTYNGTNQTTNFTSPLLQSFTSFGNSISLPDGNYSAYIRVQNVLGLESSLTRSFSVDAVPPQVSLLLPKNGVASTFVFDVVVQTQNTAACRYSFSPYNAPSPGAANYPGSWVPFDIETGYLHTKYNLNYPASSTAPYIRFFVACEEPNWPVSDATIAQINLSVDNSAPIISTSFIEPLYETPFITPFTVQTNEVTQCRYGASNQPYNQLPNAFPINVVDPYRTLNIAQITVPPSGNGQVFSQTYYVVCENLAGLQSARPHQVIAQVNLLALLNVTDYSPKFVSSPIGTISLVTNKNARCIYGNNPLVLPNDVGNGTLKKVHVENVQVGIGSNVFYTVCERPLPYETTGVFMINITYDNSAPVILEVSDNSTLNNTEQTQITDALRVFWRSVDPESGINYHWYRLEYANNNTIVKNWTTSSANNGFISVPGVYNDGARYRFGIIAVNGGGMNSTVAYTDGILINVSATNEHCTNSIRDGDETGVNCGGSVCAKCANSVTCFVGNDCLSGYCVQNSALSTYHTCQPSTCNDNVTNGNETGLDCGGNNLCPRCNVSVSCLGNADCSSGYCVTNATLPNFQTCRYPTCNDNVQNGNETGKDCGGLNLCPRCAINATCAATPDCGSGLFCNLASTSVYYGTCQSVACNDSIINGGETDVDCGTPICGLCGIGKACMSDANCEQNNCDSTYHCAPSNFNANKFNITAPSQGQHFNVSIIAFNFTSQEKVNVTGFLVNGADYLVNLTPAPPKQIFGYNGTVRLPDGIVTLELMLRNNYGVTASETVGITMDAEPPQIFLVTPPNGFASIQQTPVSVSTVNPSTCGYWIGQNMLPPPIGSFQTQWEQFPINQQNVHTVPSINIAQPQPFLFRVVCQETDISSEVFSLYYDNVAPQIVSLALLGVYEQLPGQPLTSVLSVESDEPTKCRYSYTQLPYSQMQYQFTEQGYVTNHVKTVTIPNPTNQVAFTATVFVACEDRALTPSQTVATQAPVNLLAPLQAAAVPPFTGTSTVVDLHVVTNKNAYCTYGFSPTILQTTIGNSTLKRDHLSQITLPSAGQSMVFFQCSRPGEPSTPVLNVTYIVDASAPLMLFVNDSSSGVDPQKTPSTTQLQVKYAASDPETGILQYTFRIRHQNGSIIYGPSVTVVGNDTIIVGGLSLNNGVTYYFDVHATNTFGMNSSFLSSDGITVDTSLLPPIVLDLPLNGYSSNPTPLVRISTPNPSVCGYWAAQGGLPPNPANFQASWSQFSVNQGTTHTISSLGILVAQPFVLHVACLQSGQLSIAQFSLIYDNVAPQIISASLEDVFEQLLGEPLTSRLSVTTNEPAQCRYNWQNVPFSQMGYTFGDTSYTTAHEKQVVIPNPSNLQVFSPTVYVRCQDRAQLLSSSLGVQAQVNLTVPLMAQAEPPFGGTSATAILHVTTNKHAVCYYGLSPIGALAFVGDDNFKKDHMQQVVLQPGQTTFHYYCAGLQYVEQTPMQNVTFISDATPPVVVLVNDSSSFNLNPQQTYRVDTLAVRYRAEDLESGISRYFVRVRHANGTSVGGPVALEPQSVVSGYPNEYTFSFGQNPLHNSTTYYVDVNATNGIGVNGSTVSSDGIYINTSIRPECFDGIKNGNEIGIDCGLLSGCGLCPNGLECGNNSDCVNNYCVTLPSASSSTCQTPACNDTIKNGNETDVDCGGGGCPECEEGEDCRSNADCDTSFCDLVNTSVSYQTCIVPCDDGVMNSNETDVDCGGYCPGCPIGDNCLRNSDCRLNFCDLNNASATYLQCKQPRCDDGIKNGNESDVDCGGYCGQTCGNLKSCLSGLDCVSNYCHPTGYGGQCRTPNCLDNAINNNETGQDCGGVQVPSCPRCGNGVSCINNTDCSSGWCVTIPNVPNKPYLTCQVPSCSDQIQNGAEPYPDCGGPCSTLCTPGLPCFVSADCTTAFCPGNHTCTYPSCPDGVKNGNETGVDCGQRSGCGLCSQGSGCGNSSDCSEGFCNLNAQSSAFHTCVSPGCNDGIKNGNETDIDCGGSNCGNCQGNRTCGENGDCVSNFCHPVSKTCKSPNCSDGYLNGNESDKDCGGSCNDCLIDDICRVNADCQSGYCAPPTTSGGSKTCEYATCTDGIKNGNEIDVDCGGTCTKCGDNKACTVNSDCLSGYCGTNHKCKTPGCNDGELDGDETDIDCGGSDCDPCRKGETCEVDVDCESGHCDVSRRKCDDVDKCTNGRQDPAESDADCGGPCIHKCEEGKYCVNTLDCESGLTCLETTNKCTFCSPNDPQCSGGSGELDSDIDGIPDAFENQNGLDPNDPADAALDADGDALTNLDEYNLGTQLQNEDTDGDSFSDGEEFEKGSDPTDKSSVPGVTPTTPQGHLINIILLVVGAIALIGGIAYFYLESRKSAGDESPGLSPPPFMPPPRMMPPPMARPPPPQRRVMPPSSQQAPNIPPQAKEVFSRFDEKPKAMEQKQQGQNIQNDKIQPDDRNKDVFAKLKDITRETPREQDRAMERLEKLAKEKKKK